MISILVLLIALVVIAVGGTILLGTSGGVILLVFGDVIIGGFLVYKIIKVITCKQKG